MLNPQAEQTINDLAGAITHASNQEGKGGVRVTVAKQRHNIAPLNPFALCFAESIGSLIETRKLGAPALGLLFKLLALARNGNLVSVNQRGLALQLGVHPASISRSFKQLIEAGVILEMPEGLFFNPQLVSRWGLEAVSRQYPATVVAGIAALAKQGMSANWVPPPPKAPEEA
ncbi:MAG: hypothetical protein JSS25_03320 [Proteobacteria bacterium]|nr:hypothetical protein [Pseudomonadota bacterium]